jgi:hypothetical protein
MNTPHSQAGMTVSALAAPIGALSAFAPAVMQAMPKDQNL